MPARAQDPWLGPTFRDFSGVNQAAEAAGPLFDNSLSYDRQDVPWDRLEPKPGGWRQGELEKIGQKVLDFRRRGVGFLPVLDYTAPWAADRGSRQWEHGRTRWQVTPRAGDTLDVSTFTRQADGTWEKKETKAERADKLSQWPVAAEHVQDWEGYVRRVVDYLGKPPFNVTYFQVWNEAYPTSGFWFGDLDTYMQRIHLPASRVIHAQGGKVVYGGWPDIGPIPELIALLDRNKAWDSVDVLDMHYRGAKAWFDVHKAAAERGHKDLPLWETEIGFAPHNLDFIGNTYPRLLHFALTNGWRTPDTYKVFFFPNWAPDDAKAYGYATGLYAGDHLSPHGRGLQTLAALLQGGPLRSYDGVDATPSINSEGDPARMSKEAFSVGNRVVIAIHLGADEQARWPSLNLRFPIARGRIVRAERVDLDGVRSTLTDSTDNARNGQTNVDVPTGETPGSEAERWNATSAMRTFYVVLTLQEASAPIR